MFSFLNRNNEQRIIISPSIVIFTVFFLLGLYFLFQILPILVLLFMAFIIMVALNPAVNRLQQKLKVPRLPAIIITYIVFLSVLVGTIALLLPPLIVQVNLLLKLFDTPLIQEYIADLKLTVTEIGDLINKFGGPVNFVFSAITSTFSSIFTFFTLLVMSFYLILDRPVLHHKIVWFSRKKEHLRLAKQLLDDVERELGGWVRGEFVLMVVIGALTYIGLSILGIPYALPLAIMAGALEILPNLGPTISAIPAISIALFQNNPVSAAMVAILYIVIQQLENNFIVPRVMKANANLNPLVGILSILIGAKLFGIFGALLAVPTYIVLRSCYALYLQQENSAEE